MTKAQKGFFALTRTSFSDLNSYTESEIGFYIQGNRFIRCPLLFTTEQLVITSIDRSIDPCSIEFDEIGNVYLCLHREKTVRIPGSLHIPLILEREEE